MIDGIWACKESKRCLENIRLSVGERVSYRFQHEWYQRKGNCIESYDRFMLDAYFNESLLWWVCGKGFKEGAD